jgi:hypothetical protein
MLEQESPKELMLEVSYQRGELYIMKEKMHTTRFNFNYWKY